MKFLVDNQLPQALARHLRSQDVDCLHVSEYKLERASDDSIWAYAPESGRVVISKDEDFFHRIRYHEASPRMVWVRLGNCRNEVLLDTFDRFWGKITSALERGDRVVEIR